MCRLLLPVLGWLLLMGTSSAAVAETLVDPHELLRERLSLHQQDETSQMAFIDWRGRQQSEVARWQSIIEGAPTSTNLNAYAEALTKAGKPHDAIGILQGVEQNEPGLYQTALHLASAHEATGNLVDAQHWTKMGIQRNPNARGGSEWLRLRILQMGPVALADPAWLTTHTITGATLPAGANSDPFRFMKDNTGKDLDAKSVADALAFQISERLVWSGPPDALTGALLAEYAHCLSFLKRDAEAQWFWAEAQRYGLPPTAMSAHGDLDGHSQASLAAKNSTRPGMTLIAFLVVLLLQVPWWWLSGTSAHQVPWKTQAWCAAGTLMAATLLSWLAVEVDSMPRDLNGRDLILLLTWVSGTASFVWGTLNSRYALPAWTLLGGSLLTIATGLMGMGTMWVAMTTLLVVGFFFVRFALKFDVFRNRLAS